jgi:hypothetical protein
MHMDGLQNILQLRGDFQCLKSTVAMFVSWYVSPSIGSSISNRQEFDWWKVRCAWFLDVRQETAFPSTSWIHDIELASRRAI